MNVPVFFIEHYAIFFNPENLQKRKKEYMTVTLVISLMVGIVLSISRIRAVLQVAFASHIEDGVQSPRIPEKLTGKVSENVTKSPLAKTPCAFWQVQVLVRGSKNYTTVFEMSSTDSFNLNLNGKVVRVEPAGASLLLNEESSTQWRSSIWQNIPMYMKGYKKLRPEVVAKVRSMGAKFTAYSEKNALKVVETVFTRGDRVFVSGKMKDVKGADTIRHEEGHMLIISNWSESEFVWKQIGWTLLVIVVTEIAGWYFYQLLIKP